VGGELSPDAADVSCDTILGGRVTLRQPRKGHRAGTDAVLLAAAAPANLCGLVLDIGAGVGTAGLIVALRSPLSRLGLVEDDPYVAALAKDNLALNRLSDRGSVHEADIFSSKARRAAGLMPGQAALVITNPPFADPDRTQASPDARKRSAHVMRESGMQKSGAEILMDWVRACLALLAPGGTFLMIHKPEALPDILAACGARIGAVSVLPIHPQQDKAAHRILLRGKKGSRAPFSLAPALILQEEGGFTPRAEAIHRGEALIEW
jgi:tRNA1(Val) A37 N6-methylase TrmN6